jgi:hypothetical protein
MKSLALLFVALLALPGCLYIGARGELGPRIDPAVVPRIEPGVTTRRELLEWLGPPSEYERPELTAMLLDDELRLTGVLETARRAEQVWTWQHDDLDADGTWLLLWAGFWVQTTSDLLVVFLDDAGVVADVAWAPGVVSAEAAAAEDAS